MVLGFICAQKIAICLHLKTHLVSFQPRDFWCCRAGGGDGGCGIQFGSRTRSESLWWQTCNVSKDVSFGTSQQKEFVAHALNQHFFDSHRVLGTHHSQFMLFLLREPTSCLFLSMHLLICQTLTSQEKTQPYETPQQKHLFAPHRFESFWCVAAQVTWDESRFSTPGNSVLGTHIH